MCKQLKVELVSSGQCLRACNRTNTFQGLNLFVDLFTTRSCNFNKHQGQMLLQR